MSLDLTGKKFGYLTVVKLFRETHLGKSWLCKCDCGKEVVMCSSRLLGSQKRRPEKSCGCKKKKQNGNTLRYPRIYSIWCCMIRRCYDSAADNYERYGAIGVKVCDEWKDSFQAFLRWTLEESNYKEGLTLDRIDNSKPYCPENCRWTDYYTQEQNRGVQKRNKLGILGVCPHSNGYYRAYIQRYGKRKYLGVFKTVEEAVAARKKAEEKFEQTGTL